MSLIQTCCKTLASLSRAAAKKAASHLRQAGLLAHQHDWQRRAEICERCPMRVIRNKISYCGIPYVEKPIRDMSAEGCGCPTIAKSKSPNDHCPMDHRMQPAVTTKESCSCKWCAKR